MVKTSFRIKTTLKLRLAVALITVTTAACNNAPKEANDPSPASIPTMPAQSALIGASSTPTASPAIPPQPHLPDHYYDERRGWTYYYIAAVSEDDQKRGRAVGNVHAFQYLGKNASGEHTIASLSSNGTVNYRAKCAASCRIIDTDYGEKIAFSPSSIIGAAFEDAFRGNLRIAEWVEDNVVSPSPAPRPRSTVAPAVTEPPSKIEPDDPRKSKPNDAPPAAGAANTEMELE